MKTSTPPTHHQKLYEFFSGGRKLNFKKNEVILRGDDTPQGVYFISKGFVKVYSITNKGTYDIRVILKEGDLFPVIWAFKNSFKSIFYESMNDSILYRVSQEEFHDFNNSSIEAAHAITQSLLELFSVYSYRIDNLEFDNAHDRVLYLLLLYAKRFGTETGEKNQVRIDLPINHQNIADSVNLARETVSRVMTILERKGFIAYQGRTILVCNIKEIMKLFDYK